MRKYERCAWGRQWVGAAEETWGRGESPGSRTEGVPGAPWPGQRLLYEQAGTQPELGSGVAVSR